MIKVAISHSDRKRAEEFSFAMNNMYGKSKSTYQGVKIDFNAIGYLGELCFARFLEYSGIPYKWHGIVADRIPDKYDFIVNKNRYDIKTTTSSEFSIPMRQVHKLIKNNCKVIYISMDKEMSEAEINGIIDPITIEPMGKTTKTNSGNIIEFGTTRWCRPMTTCSMEIPSLIDVRDPISTQVFLNKFSRAKHNILGYDD